MVANSKLSGDFWLETEEPVGVSEISELLGVEVTTDVGKSKYLLTLNANSWACRI